MAHEVFISYSSEDSTVANAICHFMEERGIRAWIAPRDILPGLVWSEAIVDAITASTILVLVFSSDSNKSSQVNREVEIAVSREITIIPFRIEDTPLSKSLEYFIGPHHWLDALTPPLERHIQTLVDKVEILLGRDPKKTDIQNQNKDVNPLLSEASRNAKKWVDSGYPYFMVEGISTELKAMIRNPPRNMEQIDDDTALFLMMVSIHFGGNWVKAVQQCKDQDRAIKILIDTLDTSYSRPRFRALCALQVCGREEIEKYLNKSDIAINDLTLNLINQYVIKDNVEEYLQKIKKENDSDLSQKANEVIGELMQYSNYNKR